MRESCLGFTVLGALLLSGWFVVQAGRQDTSPDPLRASVGGAPRGSVVPGPRLCGRTAPEGGMGPASYGSGVVVEAPPEWLAEPADLHDSARASAVLESLLQEEPVSWTRVGDVLAAARVPLTDVVEKHLLQAVTSENRAAAARAITRMRDGSLVPGLLALYDDARVPDGVRAGVLGVLAELEGADSDRVAEALSRRLEHDPDRDRALLRAIALRGGAAAASVLVEYVRWARAEDPPCDVEMPDLDLDRDTAGRRVALVEIGRASDPGVTGALLRAVGRPGAEVVAGALIDLDGTEVPKSVHRTRFAALAAIGGDAVVTYLLERGRRDDVLAADAFRALEQLSAADWRGRAALREALAGCVAKPDGNLAASTDAADRSRLLLRVLGRLRDPYAARLMGSCLSASCPRVRTAAVEGLGELGREARGQIAELLAVYDDSPGDEEPLRRAVVHAAGRIGGREALEFLLRLQETKCVPDALQPAVAEALVGARRRAD